MLIVIYFQNVFICPYDLLFTGATMEPISWCKMKCPKTLSEEFRKVAKVQPKYAQYSGT